MIAPAKVNALLVVEVQVSLFGTSRMAKGPPPIQHPVENYVNI